MKSVRRSRKMNAAETFRLSVTERLEAAAEEIFLLFRQSVAQYEEEIERQRQLLAIIWKPQVKLHRIDFQMQRVCIKEQLEKWEARREQQPQDQRQNLEVKRESPVIEVGQDVLSEHHLWEQRQNLEVNPEPLVMEDEEQEDQGVLSEQQLWDQGRNYEVEPEHPLMEEEQQEVKQERGDIPVSSSHEGRSKDETIFWNPDGRVSTLSEPDPAAEDHQHQPPAGPTDQVADLAHTAANSVQESQQITNQLTHSAPEPTVPEKHHICTVCSEAFSDEMGLANHLTIHTTKELFKCTSCGLVFKTGDSLMAHSNMHRSRVQCSHPGCGRIFSIKTSLRRHMMVHTGERPYSCKTCGKQFIRQDHRDIHIRSHTGEKPFSCKVCGKHFTTKSGMNSHARKIHIRERQPGCNPCGKQFKLLIDQKIHVRSRAVKKPYSCKACGKRFTTSSRLKVHMVTHTDERPYVCKICQQSYKRRDKLVMHTKRKHSDKDQVAPLARAQPWVKKLSGPSG